jgi:hypothetical protein
MLFYSLLEFRTKPDLALKKLNFERLADSKDKLYNVARNTAYYNTVSCKLCFYTKNRISMFEQSAIIP